jgi:hypothetical protein
MSGLRRAALIFGIVALLLFADGGYLLASHDNVGGDTGVLFGNSHYYLNAGSVVVISGLFVFVAAVIMLLVDLLRVDRERGRRSAAAPPAREQSGPSGGKASRTSAGDSSAREPQVPSDQPGSTEPARPGGRTAPQA